jgi:hypothetical protein
LIHINAPDETQHDNRRRRESNNASTARGGWPATGSGNVSPVIQSRLPDVSEMKHFFGIVLVLREWWEWKCIRIKRLLIVVRNLL